MIQHGMRPVPWHTKDYDFHRTFGSVSVFPTQCIVDAGFGMPNQNAYNGTFAFPALPMGCTGYTQSELTQDMDLVEYDPSFTYDKTLLMENSQRGAGCDIRDSLNSTIVFGLRKKGENDTDAFAHRNGQYFVISQAPDYFDGFRSAIFVNHRSVSLGSPWFPAWKIIGNDAIMPMPYIPKLGNMGGIIGAILNVFGGLFFGNYFSSLPWHNYKVGGFTTTNTSGQLIRNGESFLMIKSWQGSDIGDKGWLYMPRDVANAVFDVIGTGSFTVAKVASNNIKNVQFNIAEVVNNLVLRLPKPITMNEDRMYNCAKNALGTHQTLNDSVAPEVGCAEAWSAIAKLAGVQGIPSLGFAGTAQVWAFLKNSPQFEKIATPEAGATLVSPTGYGNGKVRGHVGVLARYGLMYTADWGVCSNDSSTGLFREQWALKEWQQFYGVEGGLPVEMYRFKG